MDAYRFTLFADEKRAARRAALSVMSVVTVVANEAAVPRPQGLTHVRSRDKRQKAGQLLTLGQVCRRACERPSLPCRETAHRRMVPTPQNWLCEFARSAKQSPAARRIPRRC